LTTSLLDLSHITYLSFGGHSLIVVEIFPLILSISNKLCSFHVMYVMPCLIGLQLPKNKSCVPYLPCWLISNSSGVDPCRRIGVVVMGIGVVVMRD
jgi:hypothetical protein